MRVHCGSSGSRPNVCPSIPLCLFKWLSIFISQCNTVTPRLWCDFVNYRTITFSILNSINTWKCHNCFSSSFHSLFFFFLKYLHSHRTFFKWASAKTVRNKIDDSGSIGWSTRRGSTMVVVMGSIQSPICVLVQFERWNMQSFIISSVARHDKNNWSQQLCNLLSLSLSLSPSSMFNGSWLRLRRYCSMCNNGFVFSIQCTHRAMFPFPSLAHAPALSLVFNYLIDYNVMKLCVCVCIQLQLFVCFRLKLHQMTTMAKANRTQCLYITHITQQQKVSCFGKSSFFFFFLIYNTQQQQRREQLVAVVLYHRQNENSPHILYGFPFARRTYGGIFYSFFWWLVCLFWLCKIIIICGGKNHLFAVHFMYICCCLLYMWMPAVCKEEEEKTALYFQLRSMIVYCIYALLLLLLLLILIRSRWPTRKLPYAIQMSI